VVEFDDSEFAWDQGWKLRVDSARDIYVKQCGLTAAMLVLRLAERDFDPLLVAKHLRPTNFGIRFSDIKEVLEAHGIETRARKNLSWKTVLSHLSPGSYAILHVPSPNRSKDAHYTVVACGENGEFLYMDPPRLPRAASTVQQVLKDVSITALFCQKKEQLEGVTLEAEDISFATADFSSGEFSGVIRIRNKGSRAVLISDILIPCGCIGVEFHTVILASGDMQEFRCRVDGVKWGVGESSRRVAFRSKYTDKLVSVDFKGEYKLASIAIISDRSKVCVFDLGINCKIPFTYECKVPLFKTSEEGRRLRADSLSQWCNPMFQMEGNVRTLNVSSTFDEKLMNEISSGLTVGSAIQIFAEDDPSSIDTLFLRFRQDLMLSCKLNRDNSGSFIRVSVQFPEGENWLGWHLSEVDFDRSEITFGEIYPKSDVEWHVRITKKSEQDRPFVGYLIFSKDGFSGLKRSVSFE